MDEQNQSDLENFENIFLDSFKTNNIPESEYNKIKEQSKSRILSSILKNDDGKTFYLKLAFAFSFTFLFFFALFFTSNQLSLKNQKEEIDRTISAIDLDIKNIEADESNLADIQTQLNEF